MVGLAGLLILAFLLVDFVLGDTNEPRQEALKSVGGSSSVSHAEELKYAIWAACDLMRSRL